LVRWAYEILDDQFPPSQHIDILIACGISTHETIVTSKRKRNPAFATEVLRNYGNRCAVCGYHLQIDQQIIGLEAAHIQWHAFDGPDTVENGLALCSLHHKLFDHGAFGLSDDYKLIVSQKVNGGSVSEIAKFQGAQLIRHPIDFVNPNLALFVGNETKYSGNQRGQRQNGVYSRFLKHCANKKLQVAININNDFVINRHFLIILVSAINSGFQLNSIPLIRLPHHVR